MRIKYSRTQIRKLKDLGIRPYDKLIHDQPQDWLIKNFSQGADEYPVNVSLLMRNIIWQVRERIISGEKPPLRELIRTFWYMYIKPTLSRCESLSDKPDNQYRQLIAIIVDMVKDFDLMKYKDIGFRDENQSNRIAGENENVILFAEKIGEMDFLKDIHDKYKISVLALGGKPSVLNVEYFVDSLKKKGVHLNRSFYVFSIVDFDPHGWIVRDSFIEDLIFYGVKNIKLYDLIHPDMLTAEETKLSRYRLTPAKRMERITSEWYKQAKKKNYKNMKYLVEKKKRKRKSEITYYGLEAEAVSAKRINQKLKELMLPILGKAEDYLREYELRKLNEAIRELILFKMTGG